MYKDVETVHQKLCKDIKPGDFVLGHLETLHKTGKGSDYYALVLEKTGTVCHLRYLHSSGKLWIQPQPPDESFEPESAVIKVVNPPDIANNRGQFVFK